MSESFSGSHQENPDVSKGYITNDNTLRLNKSFRIVDLNPALIRGGLHGSELKNSEYEKLAYIILRECERAGKFMAPSAELIASKLYSKAAPEKTTPPKLIEKFGRKIMSLISPSLDKTQIKEEKTSTLGIWRFTLEDMEKQGYVKKVEEAGQVYYEPQAELISRVIQGPVKPMDVGGYGVSAEV